MKKLMLLLVLANFCSKAQTIIYSENFDGAHAWSLNIPVGPEGSDPNFFKVSSDEAGVAPGGCGSSGGGDRTLHITSVFMPNGGAAYDAGGLCGLLFCPQTDRRAESPVFSTIGFTNLSLTFDFISFGDGLIDNASIYYSNNGGTSWQLLIASIKSNICPNSQGQWAAYSAVLPSSCNGKSNVKVAFTWKNNDDGVGSDPSLAINNVIVRGSFAALSSILTSTNVSCNGGSNGSATVLVNGGTPPYTYAWSPAGGNSATASGLAANTYTCTITDFSNSTITPSIVITEPPAITSAQTVVLCAGQALTVGINNYDSSGVYTDTLTASNGCDSIVTSNLTINSPINTSTTLDSLNSITANQNNATYQWINCATNTNLSNEVNQTFIATMSGSYAVVITVGNCSDTSSCENINITGLSNSSTKFINTIYPNPNNGLFTFELQGVNYEGYGKLEIYNALGKNILTEQVIINNGSIKQMVKIDEQYIGQLCLMRLIVGTSIYDSKVIIR